MTKKEYSKLKVGSKVKFTKAYEKWLSNAAYELCQISNRDLVQEYADDYIVRRAPGQGIDYYVIIKDLRSDIGERKPGAYVEVWVGNLMDTGIVAYEHMRYIK